ncbi:hypothetical protein GN244_ATG03112 [Phytophthora infestans]|uniref:Uncharacterized protein n=1 Tax=Phytophthora infestans TaxID=4787 RepID=A0A833T052_PHYIN|nr:hypothetical protein GN244_ATG03112 [Phytophthora infestans]
MDLASLLNAVSPTVSSPRFSPTCEYTCPSVSALSEALSDLPPLMEDQANAGDEPGLGTPTESQVAMDSEPRNTRVETRSMSASGISVEITPPPEDTYSSEDAAIAALHAWTKNHGFNVTKRRAFTSATAGDAVWKVVSIVIEVASRILVCCLGGTLQHLQLDFWLNGTPYKFHIFSKAIDLQRFFA